jgi:thymidylate synthase (FAD)
VNEFNYQKVKLIGLTEPKIDECKDAQELIAYIARVSNPANQHSHNTSDRLLKYCIKNAHWSVFETVNVVLEIETTRDIGRQLLRHRSFTFQEFSQRYADPTKDLSFVTRECRMQDEKNRQNSVKAEDYQLMAFWEHYQKRVTDLATEAYNWATTNGIAKEQARAVLPEGNTMSRMYVNGTLRSWIHYCQLRRGHGTQLEHIDLADKCWSVICDSFSTMKEVI